MAEEKLCIFFCHSTHLRHFCNDTKEQAYAIFLMLNRGTLVDDMNEDQKLFLFNRYDYKVTSTPMKLNSLNSNKLYKIHYKFVLK